jgi:hypothetical protein
VGALCFSRGEQRFSVAETSWTLIMRFSAGLENPGLNRLRKKVEQGAKPVPSAAKAEQISNHLRTA